jgi:hypothetical protein
MFIGAMRGRLLKFGREYWKGTVVLVVAALVFFWPIIIHIDSYSPGGDAMFNAWTLARNNHCILREGCPNYADGNIFYPHKSTMLYSETQLSAGIVSLPLYLINNNPLFEYNIVTIVSFFLSGWFMYMLAKYLSNGKEVVSIVSGLVFMFAPLKMAAIFHLQNLCIFCLPIAVLCVLRFIDATHLQRKLLGPAKKRVAHTADIEARLRQIGPQFRSWLVRLLLEIRPGYPYLIGLFIALLYVFLGSWVQMVFVLIALAVLMLMLALLRSVPIHLLSVIAMVVLLAVLTTTPLALQYVHFSKTNKATFGLREQVLYSDDLQDYLVPHEGTLLGKLYYKIQPAAIHNSYNPDSYSYHGITLYAVAITLLVVAFIYRKRSSAYAASFVIAATFGVLALIGFMISLGPILKVHGQWAHHVASLNLDLAILLPWYMVDRFLPQLSFIRAIGRASVLVLFALCCLLPVFAHYPLFERFNTRWKNLLLAALSGVVLFEIMPVHRVPMSVMANSYNLSIPGVYRYIAAHKDINNIAILRGNDDYPNAPIPMARTEDVLWAGYHNRNIFNGYSGYEPPEFLQQYIDFINFTPASLSEMKSLHLRYVIIDKQLSGPTSKKPHLLHDISQAMPSIYQDGRYVLFKVE